MKSPSGLHLLIFLLLLSSIATAEPNNSQLPRLEGVPVTPQPTHDFGTVDTTPQLPAYPQGSGAPLPRDSAKSHTRTVTILPDGTIRVVYEWKACFPEKDKAIVPSPDARVPYLPALPQNLLPGKLPKPRQGFGTVPFEHGTQTPALDQYDLDLQNSAWQPDTKPQLPVKVMDVAVERASSTFDPPKKALSRTDIVGAWFAVEEFVGIDRTATPSNELVVFRRDSTFDHYRHRRKESGFFTLKGNRIRLYPSRDAMKHDGQFSEVFAKRVGNVMHLAFPAFSRAADYFTTNGSDLMIAGKEVNGEMTYSWTLIDPDTRTVALPKTLTLPLVHTEITRPKLPPLKRIRNESH